MIFKYIFEYEIITCKEPVDACLASNLYCPERGDKDRDYNYLIFMQTFVCCLTVQIFVRTLLEKKPNLYVVP